MRLQSTAVDEQTTRDWYSNDFIGLPTSFAEVDLGVDRAFGPLQPVDTGCIDAVAIDGEAVGVRIRGSVRDAVDRRELALEACGPVAVGASFRIETAARDHGFDIDQVVLRSDRPAAPVVGQPAVGVEAHDDTSYRLRVAAAEEDRWLVLGQSHNLGWEATVDGLSLIHI